MKKYILFICLFALTSVMWGQKKIQTNLGGPHGEMDFVINWKQFYSYDEYVKIMHDMQKKYSDICSIKSIGKSRMGRDQYVLTISSKSTGNPDNKPALWMDGAIHGNEVNGVTCCLYTAWYLLTRYDYDANIKNLVDNKTIYILPMFNVDAINSYIALPNTENNPREPFRPTDDDGDGLYDEDMTEDVDGDGEISLMYAEDANGSYRLSKDGNRFIKIAADDWWEGKRFRLIGQEGYDNDGDGKTSEDDLGGVDPNRNFIYDSNKTACKTYPLSEPETRNVWLFLSAHNNILVTFNYHNSGRWIMFTIPPKSMKEDNSAEYLPPYEAKPDNVPESIKSIVDHYAFNYKVDPEYEEDKKVSLGILMDGLFIMKNYTAKEETWLNGEAPASMYHMLGKYAFLMELWGSPTPYADSDHDGKVSDEEFDKFIKLDLNGDGWIKPKKFNHPQLGEVWIGGTHKKHLDRNPPARYMEQEASKNTMFVLHCLNEFPKPKFANYKVTKIGKDLYKVEVNLINDNIFPTISDRSLQLKQYVPDEITAKISSGEIIEPIAQPEKNNGVFSRRFSNVDVKDIMNAGKVANFRTKGQAIKTFVYNILSHSSSSTLNLTYKSLMGGKDTISIKIHD